MGAEKRPSGHLAKLRAHLARSAKLLRSQLASRRAVCPNSSRKPSSDEPPNLPDSVTQVTEISHLGRELVVKRAVIRHLRPARPVSSEVPAAAIVPVSRPQVSSDGSAPSHPPPCEGEPTVHRWGEDFTGTRTIMKHIGIDIGTKTIVVAYPGADGKTNFLSEINGYWQFERATPFVENMLNDPKKKRSDGTERPARWLKVPESNRLIVLGRDAEEFAFAKNDTLQRPMAEGGISPDEDAMTVLSAIVHGLLNMAENDVGKFGSDVKICYCTTAPAINKDSSIDYHQRVVNLILDNYESPATKAVSNIKESHAIVINMNSDGTGIGISWGAGTVTVSYIKYGMEIYSFCWVGAGDWIDTQVAMRHGYDPELFKTRKKMAKETPTTVSRRKMDIDLTPGHEPEDRLGMDIVLHYDVLISNVIAGIAQGFEAHESQARIEEGVNVYMAGGTSSPKGFVQRVAKKLDEATLPFSIGEVKRSSQPLYCVAEGLLKAAEMF